jgi:hypothetical protein
LLADVPRDRLTPAQVKQEAAGVFTVWTAKLRRQSGYTGT